MMAMAVGLLLRLHDGCYSAANVTRHQRRKAGYGQTYLELHPRFAGNVPAAHRINSQQSLRPFLAPTWQISNQTLWQT